MTSTNLANRGKCIAAHRNGASRTSSARIAAARADGHWVSSIRTMCHGVFHGVSSAWPLISLNESGHVE